MLKTEACADFSSWKVHFLYLVLRFSEPVVYIGIVPFEQGFVHGGVLGCALHDFFFKAC